MAAIAAVGEDGTSPIDDAAMRIGFKPAAAEITSLLRTPSLSNDLGMYIFNYTKRQINP
jgi:hypothetical protein